MKIVCLTSDLYINCLQPFAYYWNKFAGADRQVTIAGYDMPLQVLPMNFEVVSIGNQADYTWSAGLLKFLEGIEDDVILLMLEDYFLTEPVNWRVVESLLGLMRHDKDVIKCDLTDDRLKVPYSATGFFWAANCVTSDSEAPFQTSLQAALWRKDALQRFLDPSENAWQFEKKGTKRLIEARRAISDDRYPFSQHLQVIGTLSPPMQYINAVGGEGNHPGVITTKYMPIWMRDECTARGWVTQS